MPDCSLVIFSSFSRITVIIIIIVQNFTIASYWTVYRYFYFMTSYGFYDCQSVRLCTYFVILQYAVRQEQYGCVINVMK